MPAPAPCASTSAALQSGGDCSNPDTLTFELTGIVTGRETDALTDIAADPARLHGRGYNRHPAAMCSRNASWRGTALFSRHSFAILARSCGPAFHVFPSNPQRSAISLPVSSLSCRPATGSPRALVRWHVLHVIGTKIVSCMDRTLRNIRKLDQD